MFIRLLENNITVRKKNVSEPTPILKTSTFPCLHFTLFENQIRFNEKTYQCAKVTKRDYPVLQTMNMIVVKFESGDVSFFQPFKTKILVIDQEDDETIISKNIDELITGDSVLRFNMDVDYTYDEVVSVSSMSIISDEELEESDPTFKKGYHKYIIGSNNTSCGMIVNDLFLL